MINYFFAINVSNNEIVFDKPKNKKETYRIYVKQAVARIKPDSLMIGGKGKKRFPNDERILYQKMDSKLLIAAIVTKVRRNSEIYTLFQEFYNQMQKYRGQIRDNDELEQWTKKQIKTFNETKRQSFTEIDKSDSSYYTQKLSLIQIDEEELDIENPTFKPLIIEEERDLTVSKSIYIDDFNGKTQIVLWGVFGMVGLCLGMIGIELFTN